MFDILFCGRSNLIFLVKYTKMPPYLNCHIPGNGRLLNEQSKRFNVYANVLGMFVLISPTVFSFIFSAFTDSLLVICSSSVFGDAETEDILLKPGDCNVVYGSNRLVGLTGLSLLYGINLKLKA